MPKSDYVNQKAWETLPQLIARHFTLDDIKVLCFELQVNYNDLGENQGITVKIVSLLNYMIKHKRIQEMMNSLAIHRPDVTWPQIPTDYSSLHIHSIPSPKPSNPTFNISGDINAGITNIGGNQTFTDSINIDMRHSNPNQ